MGVQRYFKDKGPCFRSIATVRIIGFIESVLRILYK